MTYRAQAAKRAERDERILAWHVEEEPGGLKCPLCGRWSPISTDSPQGIRLACRYADCGVIAVMPRVQLARALRSYRKA